MFNVQVRAKADMIKTNELSLKAFWKTTTDQCIKTELLP